MMEIRNYRASDTPEMIELFYETVHTVCRSDYTEEQLDAWAPKNIEVAHWEKRFSLSFTLLAEENNQLLGFANLEANGNVDMFYVAANTQGKGVGKGLMNEIVKKAKELGLNTLTSDVSLTARPFFLKMGFVIDKVYEKQRAGMTFKNTLMSLNLLKTGK